VVAASLQKKRRGLCQARDCRCCTRGQSGRQAGPQDVPPGEAVTAVADGTRVRHALIVIGPIHPVIATPSQLDEADLMTIPIR